MGLDMYLMLSKYESEYDREKPLTINDLPKEIADIYNIKQNYIAREVRYNVGYWRKFNALHNYIVENFADGEDNCKPVYIDYNDLKSLLATLKEIDKDHKKAKELLPTQDGFFFGSTEYDKWYFEDIKYSIVLFEEVLNAMEKYGYNCYYEASW